MEIAGLVALIFAVWLLVGLVFGLVVGPILAYGKPPLGARTPQATRERER